MVELTNLRLDQYLTEKLPDLSRSKIQNFIKLGQVTVNGEKAKPSWILKGNEKVECSFHTKIDDPQLVPEEMDLEILFEDDHLVVINKPAGLVVHPGSGNWTGTLLHGLLHHFQHLSRAETPRPGIVHRLDRDTSGVIMIAKQDRVHDHISEQFAQRMVKKKYLALVWGELDEKGSICGGIARDPRNRKIFKMVESGGRDSITHYESAGFIPPLSWVKLKPETGRTHQLRVHLNSIGHPIFCDQEYGGGLKQAKSFHVRYTTLINRILKSINRVALHAQMLEIIHPNSGKRMVFSAPIPPDMQTALNILKNEQA